MKEEYYIMGYFDVEDRPNLEVIYIADSGDEALDIYNKIIKSTDPELTDDKKHTIKKELMNIGVADLWLFENNFQLLHINKVQKWNLEEQKK